MRNLPNERLSADIDETGPERKCILSGTTEPRDALVRLAVSPPGPDGRSDVLPDVRAKAPGRGAWIGVSRDELEKAIAKGKLKGALARAFRGAPLVVPEDLPERIESALQRLLADRLGLEMKSGNLLVGSDRIAEQARAGRVEWLAHSSDASADGSRKLDQAWRVGTDSEGSGLAGTALPLDRAALSVALGRDNVVHLALTDKAAARRVAVPLQRLMRFLGRTEANGNDPGTVPAHGAGHLAATTN
ncbi:hypothetical protein GCM10011371_13520 [Novosphingobium marinum]|uniref:YlxR domain-containing protein n=1 Tax=Novosphingobium marinum TaxID=1514948 RepID=A0A7Y9XY23_9SPHN|nr:DUF448 domain-containing protein [Novosphingobium marinum]NYH95460.1 hypothetical protein [Novosphingobium marinum]GGC27247.1 hypothetical protein GCM10011371_13520 [Novosphingobium marinum]